MENKLKIALLQMEIVEKNTKANISHGLEMVEAAAPDNDIVVLPEIWSTGYALGHLKEEYSTLEGPELEKLQRLAKEHHCSIVAGSLPIRMGNKIYNSSPAINKKGQVVNVYSKAHLFGMFNEERFFAPGDNFEAFDLSGVTCGSSICYDLRFPELYRHLALQGAKLFFVPAEWPTARGDIWSLLARARAAENHCYLAAVNAVGTFKGAPFYGHSVLVDPMGRAIAEGGDKEEIIQGEIDLAYVDKVRSAMNVLLDVRKELIK